MADFIIVTESGKLVKKENPAAPRTAILHVKNLLEEAAEISRPRIITTFDDATKRNRIKNTWINPAGATAANRDEATIALLDLVLVAIVFMIHRILPEI